VGPFDPIIKEFGDTWIGSTFDWLASVLPIVGVVGVVGCCSAANLSAAALAAAV